MRKNINPPKGGDDATWYSWSQHSPHHFNPWLGIEVKDGKVVKIRVGNG